MTSQARVVDLFSRESYRGGNGIDKLDDKLGQIGLAEIEQLRADSYNVSNFMFFLIFGTMALLTIISGAQSVIIGYMMGGDDGILSTIEATRMGLFQLTLLACGIVIGCRIGETANKEVLAVLTVLLGAGLMVVTITTGLAFLYFIQDVASQSGDTKPINHFFAAVAANSSLFDSPQSVQKTFNIFCVVVFEIAVISTPILFKSINAPVREGWETRKRINAFLTIENSKQRFTDSIAITESRKMKTDAKIYRDKRNTEMETRALVMADMLNYEKKMAKLWMARKGILSSMKYRLSGIHDTDDEFISYVTNPGQSAGESAIKKT